MAFVVSDAPAATTATAVYFRHCKIQYLLAAQSAVYEAVTYWAAAFVFLQVCGVYVQ